MAFDLGVKDGKPVYGGWPIGAESKQISEEERTIDFVFSDETLDRDQEIIRSQGWQLEKYRKNPVFLFAHEYWSLPIGKSIQTWISDRNQLLGRVKFAAAENGNEVGEAFFRLYKDGFMNAVSVGFMGIRIERSADWDALLPSGARREFIEQELMECSAVPVPANPNARIIRRLEPGMSDSIRAEIDKMKAGGIVGETTLSAIVGAYDRLERRKSLWFPVRQCKHQDPCGEVRQRGECEYNGEGKAESAAKDGLTIGTGVAFLSENPSKGGQVLNASNKRLLKMMYECCCEMMANAGMEPMEEPEDMPAPMEEPEEMAIVPEKIKAVDQFCDHDKEYCNEHYGKNGCNIRNGSEKGGAIDQSEEIAESLDIEDDVLSFLESMIEE